MFTPEDYFKKTWRPYQQRVLEQLDDYLSDSHIHIVAAPGSGKTVLGLEILRRLNLPTLIFTPTRSIREQWVNRLVNDFMAEEQAPDWLSLDIKSLSPLTISTYQALSSIYRDSSSLASLKESLHIQNIKVIIVDEAHHLRANWWKCLEDIKSSLDNPIVVALTATPPIDVPQAEWNRYASFCGAVDIEVNIPELVKSETLSPHQDYIYLNQPTESELRVLNTFRGQVDKCLLAFQLDLDLAKKMISPKNDWIREADGKAHYRKHQLFYLALSIYLRNATAVIPPAITKAYHLEGDELPTKLPIEMATRLFQGLFYDFNDRLSSEVLDGLSYYKERLAQIGAIEKKQVQLKGSNQLDTILKSSPAKLHSISEILGHELDLQGEGIRAVILADYIRKEALSTSGDLEEPLNKLGVAPIFELLRRLRFPRLSLAMLTGSITIIPCAQKKPLAEVALKYGITEITFEEMLYDQNYCYISVKASEQDRLTLIITELFEDGALNCLVGTAALLGEGWDAPSVNTLILATYVGSFVMSNQMRGRAIRRDAKNPDKVANIWHLATVAPDQEESKFAQKDFQKLVTRFKHFHGVSRENDEVIIEAGLNRIDLEGINAPVSYNQKMLRTSSEREKLTHLWEEAFSKIPDGRFLRPIKEVIFNKEISTSKFILRIEGNRGGLRASVGHFLRERRLRGVAETLLKFLLEQNVFLASQEYGHPTVRISKGKIVVTLPHASSHVQAAYAELLEQCYNPFYLSDYFLTNGDQFLMIPKKISKRAKGFHKKLTNFGYRRYKFYSTASREGQNALMSIRNAYLLAEDFRGHSETRTKWG